MPAHDVIKTAYIPRIFLMSASDKKVRVCGVSKIIRGSGFDYYYKIYEVAVIDFLTSTYASGIHDKIRDIRPLIVQPSGNDFD